jgi:hypothetical protein
MDKERVINPADLPFVTFDNNVLIALRNNESAAPAVRELLELNRTGLIALNVTMSTAMEAQQPEEQLGSQEQIAWIESLGIPRSNIFTSSRSVGFVTPGEPNTMTFDPLLEVALAERIHTILFPRVPFSWRDYCECEYRIRSLTERQKSALLELEQLRWGGVWTPPRPTPASDIISAEERQSLQELLQKLHRDWFTAKNDAFGFYAHLTLAWHTTHREHAVFVTSARNFHKQAKLIALGELGYLGKILSPAEAISFLRNATAMTELSKLEG